MNWSLEIALSSLVSVSFEETTERWVNSKTHAANSKYNQEGIACEIVMRDIQRVHQRFHSSFFSLYQIIVSSAASLLCNSFEFWRHTLCGWPRTVVQVSENHSRQQKAGVYGNQKKYKEAIGREEISFVSTK